MFLANTFLILIIDKPLNLSWIIVDCVHVLILHIVKKERLHVAELLVMLKPPVEICKNLDIPFMEIEVFKCSKDISSFPVINKI